ncbi:MAG: serine/threonine protein kinase [Pyrinomonadaceae bacterium]
MKGENVVGQTLDDKYRIESEIGKGGMGTVYFATHVGTERHVAVKVIAPEFMQRLEFVERFKREARAAGRLRHPNVVNVTDFGFADTRKGNVAYLVMEYLDGCTLGEVLEEEKKLPLSWTLDILEQVCSAVEEAHAQGIIHRDLKPDNIWLEPNQRGGYTVKVLDFGIAKLEEQMHDTAAPPELDISVAPNFQSRATIADAPNGETVAENRNRTAVSEAATIAQFADNDLEAGTLIQASKVDLESGTAIFPANHSAQSENDGTKLHSEKIETNKSASQNSPTSELTRVGAVLGTPLYMSPEQCRGEKLNARSDIYSLGVIAYQMLSGATPFSGDYKEVMKAHQEIAPPALDVKKVPKKVKKIIGCALAKNLEERPATAESFASKLRAGSEGLGELFRRGLVIYSEHLPQFLLVSLLTALPFVLITILKVTLKSLELGGIVEDGKLSTLINVFFSVTAFFIQIFYVAFLVGITTWIVAQVLALPLRPVSVRAAFAEAKKHWKPLTATVTASTLLSMLGLAFCILPGIWLSVRYALIAPSIMMENLRGKAAFKRSTELSKRAFGTILGTVILLYVVPGILAFAIAISISGIVKSVADELKSKPQVTKSENKEDNFTVNLGSSGKIDVASDERENVSDENAKKPTKSIVPEIATQIFEIIWLPIIILISSFTSVITALLYFKTRQAGGESMQDLLAQFEKSDQPRTNWQKRVQKRLGQSGRITSKS